MILLSFSVKSRSQIGSKNEVRANSDLDPGPERLLAAGPANPKSPPRGLKHAISEGLDGQNQPANPKSPPRGLKPVLPVPIGASNTTRQPKIPAKGTETRAGRFRRGRLPATRQPKIPAKGTETIDEVARRFKILARQPKIPAKGTETNDGDSNPIFIFNPPTQNPRQGD